MLVSALNVNQTWYQKPQFFCFNSVYACARLLATLVSLLIISALQRLYSVLVFKYFGLDQIWKKILTKIHNQNTKVNFRKEPAIFLRNKKFPFTEIDYKYIWINKIITSHQETILIYLEGRGFEVTKCAGGLWCCYPRSFTMLYKE